MTKIETILGFGDIVDAGRTGFPRGIPQRLDRSLNLDRQDFKIVNLGVGGDTTRQMLARTGTVETHKPDCTIVLLGCNDMPRTGDGSPERRTSLEEYAQNLKLIFPKLRSKRSIFLTSFYVKWIDEALFVRYMDTARQLAEGYEIWDLFRDSAPCCPVTLLRTLPTSTTRGINTSATIC